MSKKIGDRFTDSQMLQLVKIYREYECLWNPKSLSYKNQDARRRAYQQIADKLNIPGVTTQDIPKKIKNLRSSYYQELKRIKNGKRSSSGVSLDVSYKPKVSWFSTADEILKHFRNQRKTVSNVEENSSTSDNDSESQEVKSTVDNNIEEEFTETSYSTVSIAKDQESIVYKTDVSSNKVYKNKVDQINEAIAKIDKIVNRLEKNEDEFDSFGKYIATTLRSLPGELSIAAKIDIQKAISEIQLKALSQASQPTMLSYGTATYDPLNPGFLILKSEPSYGDEEMSNISFTAES